MLKVYIHGGSLDKIRTGNRLATLDIGYRERSDIASYLTVLNIKGIGEVGPQLVERYPRWSGSLWDLVARCLTRCLYLRDQPMAFGAPAKNPAFADGICAVIEKWTGEGQMGQELGWAEVSREPRSRTQYIVQLDEDILGTRKKIRFTYGPEVLNPADLLLRSICWSLHKCETLGPKPVPHLPPLLEMNGVDHIAVSDLQEPAKTGLTRYLGVSKHHGLKMPTHEPLLVPADDYVTFLGAA